MSQEPVREGKPIAGLEEQAAAELPSAEALTTLHAQLTTLRRECLATLRTRHLRAFPAFVGQSDLDWLNRELVGIRALNRRERPYHRVVGPERWASPPIARGVLLCAADLLPLLSDALQVLVRALMRLKAEVPDG